MSIEITCPSCQTQHHVVDNMEGKRVRCPKCGDAFPVRQSRSASENNSIANRRRGRGFRDRAEEEFDDYEERPHRSRRGPRRRFATDDNYDRRPSPLRSKTFIFVIVGGALLLAGGCVTVGAWLWLSESEPPALKEGPAIQVVKNGGDAVGIPRFEQPNPPAEIPVGVDPALANANDKVYLSDMQEFAVTEGPRGWSFAKNGELGNSYVRDSRIQVGGRAYPKGVSMHPPFHNSIRACYALGGRAKTFAGSVALNDDNSYGSPATRFVVYGDDRLLWRSSTIQQRNLVHTFSIDVEGVQILELRTYVENGSVTGAHAVWLDPYVRAK